MSQEQDRLTALHQYDVLDTPPEEKFDRITRLVRRLLGVPIATITFVDAHRQWFKSRQGIDERQTEKKVAFCRYAIQQDAPLIIPDSLEDTRFRDNPLVTGHPHIRFYAGVQLRTSSGQTIGTLCAIDTVPRSLDPDTIQSLRDLAQIVMDELELRNLASTDGLTGLLVRRAFRDEAGRAIALALRARHDLSCIVIDVDRFKVINDTFGHGVGDRVLSRTAEALRKNLRASDIVGRIGGEEFAALLPQTDLDKASGVAESLRFALESQNFDTSGGAVRLSASFGIVSLDPSVIDIDDLLQRADQALYEAKLDGRNCCKQWKPRAAAPMTPHQRVFKAGRILFNGDRSTIDCTVRSLSATSARLDVTDATGVPENFKLHIMVDEFSAPARVIARHNNHVEVDFCPPQS